MKTAKCRLSVIILWSALLMAASSCGQQEHKKEEKHIRQNRIMEEKATADLNNAVTATDEATWDANAAYKLFRDSTKLHLAKNTQFLSDFKLKVSKGQQKIPLRYRRHIRKLEQRNEELRQRLDHYPMGDKAGWEDFTELYQYDLQRLEQDIHQLKVQGQK